MKIRNGFVSNSSSSSFIIENHGSIDIREDGEYKTIWIDKDTSLEDVKHRIFEDVVKLILEWKEKTVRNIPQNLRRGWKKYPKWAPETAEERKAEIQKSKDYYNTCWSEEKIRDTIAVATVKEINNLEEIMDINDPKYYTYAVDLPYWYPRSVLKEDNIIILSGYDNYIPQEVMKTLVKRYDIDDNCWHGHMG